MKNKKALLILFILFLLIVVAAGGVLWWQGGGGGNSEGVTESASTDGWGAVAYEDDPVKSPTASSSLEDELNGASTAPEQEWQTFSHESYRFSFKYPPSLKVGTFEYSGNDEVVVVQNADEKQGFQIYLTPVSDNQPVTAEQVRSELPDVQVEGVQPFNVGDRQSGIIFRSNNEAFGGDSREIWFNHNGMLYQISTYASLDELLGRVMQTWEFK